MLAVQVSHHLPTLARLYASQTWYLNFWGGLKSSHDKRNFANVIGAPEQSMDSPFSILLSVDSMLLRRASP